MDQEGLEILKMVQEGRVSAEQGAELLAALKTQASGAPTPGGRAKFVRCRINVKGENQEKVAINVNLPVGLADLALKMADGMKIQSGDQTIAVGEYVKQLGGMDLGAVLQMVKEGGEGKLVDIDVEGENGEHVKVEVTVD